MWLPSIHLTMLNSHFRPILRATDGRSASPMFSLTCRLPPKGTFLPSAAEAAAKEEEDEVLPTPPLPPKKTICCPG